MKQKIKLYFLYLFIFFVLLFTNYFDCRVGGIILLSHQLQKLTLSLLYLIWSQNTNNDICICDAYCTSQINFYPVRLQ